MKENKDGEDSGDDEPGRKRDSDRFDNRSLKRPLPYDEIRDVYEKVDLCVRMTCLAG